MKKTLAITTTLIRIEEFILNDKNEKNVILDYTGLYVSKGLSMIIIPDDDDDELEFISMANVPSFTNIVKTGLRDSIVSQNVYIDINKFTSIALTVEVNENEELNPVDFSLKTLLFNGVEYIETITYQDQILFDNTIELEKLDESNSIMKTFVSGTNANGLECLSFDKVENITEYFPKTLVDEFVILPLGYVKTDTFLKEISDKLNQKYEEKFSISIEDINGMQTFRVYLNVVNISELQVVLDVSEISNELSVVVGMNESLYSLINNEVVTGEDARSYIETKINDFINELSDEEYDEEYDETEEQDEPHKKLDSFLFTKELIVNKSTNQEIQNKSIFELLSDKSFFKKDNEIDD
jgi:uncharacterized protein YuzB (UPF0349 family)